MLYEVITDIKLGEGVVEKGGLHIIGTERHESRRVDNQLRGRAGRQGDPGSSRFYLSLEDDLLRIFGSDRISPLMEKLGMEEGEPIEHNLINKAVVITSYSIHYTKLYDYHRSPGRRGLHRPPGLRKGGGHGAGGGMAAPRKHARRREEGAGVSRNNFV